MPTNLNSNKLHVIVGLGKTGLSCVRYLSQCKVPIAVTDSRLDPPGLTELKTYYPHVPVSLGAFDESLCERAEELVVSPGVSLHEPVIAKQIARGLQPIGDIELFARHATSPIIAITGSNGKSTVTSLVGEMARQAQLHVGIGGNLGTPALDLLAIANSDLFVVELSSFQLETTYSLTTAAAVILNISEDHMDRYASLTDYLAAKQRIYHGCLQAIVNRDDKLTWRGLSFNNAPISFGLDEPPAGHFGLRSYQGIEYLVHGENKLLPTTAIKIKGRHQTANALAALALGYAAGLPMSAMLQTLTEFPGLAHRCQWITQSHGIDWYNDSKATNVGAALASIEGIGPTLTGKLILIAGGLGKNADFTPLHDAVKKYVRTLILIGKDAHVIEQALQSTTHMQHAGDLTHAVKIALQHALPGDAVLLAPACASYDMFNNFEHRGDVFISTVRALA